MSAHLFHGDCRELLPALPQQYVDTVICDPPYGLAFMGKGWDQQVPGPEYWKEILRVTKPGGTLLAFGGTRTYHRLACAIEDAGWELRDCVMWLYGSGFPKSLDISKAIDAAAGAEREVVSERPSKPSSARTLNPTSRMVRPGTIIESLPNTSAAQLWDGYGTALKPAYEPIIVAQRPTELTYADNALRYGVAGLNIDGCRIEVTDAAYARNCSGDRGHAENRSRDLEFKMGCGKAHDGGRWPANIILDEEAAALLDEQAPSCGASAPVRGTEDSEPTDGIYGKMGRVAGAFHGDKGGASRFFYCAKSSKSDRGAGNDHPTVKPQALMRYLCRLTQTPTGGVVLDPFMGSGTTGVAALAEGRSFIGIELDQHNFDIAWGRIEAPARTA